MYKNVKESVYIQQDRNKRSSDLQRRNKYPLEVGSEVLVTTHVLSNRDKGLTAKFVPKRDGPYTIIEKRVQHHSLLLIKMTSLCL